MVELSINSWWLYVGLGVLAGILSGALGVGSGILLIPALVILCHFPQKSAQGTALAVMVPMAVVGAIRYKVNPEIGMDFQLAGLLALGAVAGSLLGSEIAIRLSPYILRKAFAVFVLVVAVRMFFTTTKGATVPPAETTQVERTNPHGDR